nr:hypothetical protein B0A51_05502 [Rachicladosporium sp. CCFEE 5018]
MSLKRKHEDITPSPPSAEPPIFRSAPISDRESTFIGLFSPTLPPKDLQHLAEIKPASHRVLAWRRESNQQSLTHAKQYVTGHDDDGEKYGGSKVEKVLISMGVTGSCVVARWYGGVMLGPVRFTHMENAAREAVQKWQEDVVDGAAKKRKVEDDAAEKETLVRVLGKRDQSVTVLRALAFEKEAMAKRAAEGEAPPLPPESVIIDATATSKSPKAMLASSQAKPKYDDMELSQLRMLEKARDASITFLLKRIDKAEAQLVPSSTPPKTKVEPP